MFRTLTTILMGRMGRAEARLETDNAALIIEQKLREAEAGHEAAKRGLARLLTKAKSEARALETLEARLSDMTGRTRAALEAGRDELARDAAVMVADLENERAVRTRTLEGTEERAARVRVAIEKTHRQLVDLRQGLITAQSVERERRAVRDVRGDLSAGSAIREGEAVLKRLLATEDPVGLLDALEEIEADLDGTALTERLADAGFGDPLKTRAEDVLDRLRADALKPKRKSA